MTVLKGDNNACLGSKIILSLARLCYAVDVRGKELNIMSKESLFARPYSFAVSKYFVAVLGM